MEIFFKKLIANISFLMLRILDGIMELFSVMTGISDNVTSDADGNQVGKNILNFFMEQEIITKIFISVVLISVFLLALFTIFAFIKSMVSTKKPPAKIMEQFAGAFLAFFVVQIVLLGGIFVSNQTLQIVNDEFIVASDYNDLTLSQRIVALSVDEDGWRTKEDGTKYTIEDFTLPKTADEFFGMYDKDFGFEQSSKVVEGVDENGNPTYEIKKDTWEGGGIADLYRTNLFILFFATAAIFILLIMSLIDLARRLFDILFLYICMPMSVSTIPLDDGAKFKLWREAIISKVLCVYGTVIAINLYIMFLEIIGDGINIGTASKWVNTLFDLVLMIGGALAASSGAKLFGSLIGAQSDPGRNLGQTIYTALMAGQMTGGIMKGIGGTIFGKKGSMGGGIGGGTGGRSGGLLRGAGKVLGATGKGLFGNRYTSAVNTGKSAYNSLKETLKGAGAIMNESGGLVGATRSNINKLAKTISGNKAMELDKNVRL